MKFADIREELKMRSSMERKIQRLEEREDQKRQKRKKVEIIHVIIKSLYFKIIINL